MREILFRGGWIKNGEWIEGYYVFLNDTHYIIEAGSEDWGGSGEWFQVVPKTVGQFTGKVDKNGMKIFEGDIFQLEDDIVAVVVFSDGCFRLEEYGLCGTWTESGYDECGGGYGIIECEPIDWYFLKDMEIIGNIYDNPELIPC